MKNRFSRLLSAVMAIVMATVLLPVQAVEDSSVRQPATATEIGSEIMLGFDSLSSQQVWSFDPASANEAQLIGSLGETIYGSPRTNAVEYINDTLYFYANTGLYFSAPAASPQEMTPLGYIDVDEYLMYDLDFDYSTNTLYALGEDFYGNMCLLTIDKETGNYVDSYPLNGSNIAKMGITTDGNIYALSRNGLLSSIAISNGTVAETVIGTAGICPNLYSSMAYDHNGGAMYATVYSSTELYRIDLETAEVESVGNFGFTVKEMVSIYENNDVPSIPTESVELDIHTLSLGLGQIDTINACVYPVNATDRSVVWTSDNEAVATVDANGVVTGVSLGVTTITATTVSGGHTASCTVEVSPLGDLGEALNVGGCTNMYNTGHDYPWKVATILDDICARTTLLGFNDSYMETRVTLNAGDVINFWHYVELEQGEGASLRLSVNGAVVNLYSNESFFPRYMTIMAHGHITRPRLPPVGNIQLSGYSPALR